MAATRSAAASHAAGVVHGGSAGHLQQPIHIHVNVDGQRVRTRRILAGHKP